jgi:hypothetical protein
MWWAYTRGAYIRGITVVSPTGRFANGSFRQRSVRQRLESIRQRLGSIRQRLGSIRQRLGSIRQRTVRHLWTAGILGFSRFLYAMCAIQRKQTTDKGCVG